MSILPAEYFLAILSFVDVSDMVWHIISILRAVYWITDRRCPVKQDRKLITAIDSLFILSQYFKRIKLI